jgi:hypothetical protein
MYKISFDALKIPKIPTKIGCFLLLDPSPFTCPVSTGELLGLVM